MSGTKYVSEEEYLTVMEQALPVANQIVSVLTGKEESVCLIAIGMVLKGNCVTAGGDLEAYLRVVEVAARSLNPNSVMKAQ